MNAKQILQAATAKAIANGAPVIVGQPSESCRTVRLQAQFICPIWAVWFGKSVNVYFTRYHLDQFTRALSLNGTEYRAFDGNGASV